jgi:hypothetical protein
MELNHPEPTPFVDQTAPPRGPLDTPPHHVRWQAPHGLIDQMDLMGAPMTAVASPASQRIELRNRKAFQQPQSLILTVSGR